MVTVRLLGVVEYLLASYLGAGRVFGVLARIQVAVPAGEGARGYLHPDAVAGLEGDTGGPQVHSVLVYRAGHVPMLGRLYEAAGRVALTGARPSG